MEKGIINSQRIPKKIWFLWFQGIEEAPFLVKKCYESWKNNNPDWELILLDGNNVDNYISLDISPEKYKRLEIQKQSNLIRLELLSTYGGVWVDATCFCAVPLDDWIHDYTSSGFFCFYKPGKERIMSTWFFAAEKNNALIVKINKELTSFFENNEFENKTKVKKFIIRILGKFFNRNEKTTKYWLSYFVIKILKIYPYFIFHYIFANLVMSDNECRDIWNNTKKVSADFPHRIVHYGMLDKLTITIKEKIDNKADPLYKLTWKYPVEKYAEGSILHYLLERHTTDYTKGNSFGSSSVS